MERPFKCKTCGKRFKRKQNLSTHMLSHTGYQRYKCKICGKKFVYGHDFKSHMNVHNGIKPYKCNECNKSFLRAAELKIHRNSGIHAGIRPWKCTKCKKSFSQQPHLKAHLRFHSGDKPFKCQLCSQSFTQSSHLNSHMLHHTGAKPHQCTLCKLRYRLKTTLNSHMRTHTGERPYQCPHCPRAFSQHTPLSEHIKSCHGNQKFPCGNCDKVFLTKNQLQRHEKGTHPEGPFKYVCVFCGRGGQIRSIVWNHIRQHIEEKPYFCMYCDRSFANGSEKRRCEKKHKNRKQTRNKKPSRISKSLTEKEKQKTEKLVEEVAEDSPFSPPPPLLMKEQEAVCSKSSIKEGHEKLNGNCDSENGNIGQDANSEQEECHSNSSTSPPSPSHDEDKLPDCIADSPPSLDLEVNQVDEDKEPEPPGTEELIKENGVQDAGPFSCNICKKTFLVKTQLNGHIGYHRKFRKRINRPPKKSKNPARRNDLVKIESKLISPAVNSSPSMNSSTTTTTEELECQDVKIDLNLKVNFPIIKTEIITTATSTSLKALLERKLKKKAQILLNAQKLKARRNPFKCSKCPYSASCEISLQLHVKLAHDGVECHQCKFCWKRFPAEIKLIAHLAREHEEDTKKQDGEGEKQSENKSDLIS